MTLYATNSIIHFGNQFSSRERWIPTSRHALQVHCPSFGMCCMMTTITTYISGTNSHLKNGGSPIPRHTFEVHYPLFGMCCMMTTVTTDIWGTNSHLEK